MHLAVPFPSVCPLDKNKRQTNFHLFMYLGGGEELQFFGFVRPSVDTFFTLKPSFLIVRLGILHLVSTVTNKDWYCKF